MTPQKKQCPPPEGSPKLTRKAAGKTCENQRQSDEKSTKNRPKTEENPRKTGFGRLWALRVGLGRVKVAQKRARDGLRTTSWPSWTPSWPSWLPCWPSWTSSCRSRSTQMAFGAVPGLCSNKKVRSNGVYIDFSSFLSCRAKAPMCFPHQFLRCFVAFERS